VHVGRAQARVNLMRALGFELQEVRQVRYDLLADLPKPGLDRDDWHLFVRT